jgi:hydroxymethylbilane synthase
MNDSHNGSHATRLRIGSRGSQLALWQANHISALLRDRGHEVEIEIIHTTGDKITDVPLSKVGTKGLFTKEIEEALLDERIDLAVHSLKDMPTDLPSGLTLAAIPAREDPRDALVGKRLSALAAGARVGTSSLRRAAQLRAIRPDLTLETIRGNVDTRLRKLDEGQYDAIVLASAGLRRLGWVDRITELLDPELMCPAVGQGALAVETRDSGRARDVCSLLDHGLTRTAVLAERAVLARLGGGCQVPIGAHATVDAPILNLRAVVVSPDGTSVIRKQVSGPANQAEQLGRDTGDALLAAGGRQILEAVYGTSADTSPRS